VVFGQLVDRSLEWQNYELTLNEANQILVKDVLNESSTGSQHTYNICNICSIPAALCLLL
jgi:hypothetical protein